MPPQRAGPKHLVPDHRPGLLRSPRQKPLLKMMLPGFALPRLMTSAAAKAAHAARAARRVGRAMDVVRVPGAIGRDAGREGP